MAKTISDSKVRRIAAMYREGFGTQIISRELGIAKSTVERVLYCQTPAAQKIIGRRLANGRRPANELARYRSK